jgi:hypothetical protein
MDHGKTPCKITIENAGRRTGCPARLPDWIKLVLCLLAGLVGDAAAGLAGALAGGLALTAATVLEALHHITGLEGLNVLHNNSHSFAQFWIILIVHRYRGLVKPRPGLHSPPVENFGTKTALQRAFHRVFHIFNRKTGVVFHSFHRVFNIFNVDNPFTQWITAPKYTECEQVMNTPGRNVERHKVPLFLLSLQRK